MNNKERVLFKMIEFDRGDPKRIQHFLKVYEFVRLIASGENLDENTAEILEVAAILHDIGIHPSEEKYGDCNGTHQEEQGPEYAKQLLNELDCYDDKFTERVCYLIGHHHTYNTVDGIDYQILIEADFLVNAYEDNLFSSDNNTIQKIKKQVFKTKTGKWLLDNMF